MAELNWASLNRPAKMVLGIFVFAVLMIGIIYFQARAHIENADLKVERHNNDKKDLLRKLAAAEVASEILRSSQLSMRQMVEQQQIQNAEQEKELDFYRQLMTSDGKREGLELNSYVIKPADERNIYDYQFTFVQYAKKHLVLKAELSITVEGKSLLEKSSYNFSELIKPEDGFGKLRFKYFQKVEGQIILPEGFIPSELVVSAKIHKKKSKAWQRKLNWNVEESRYVWKR